MGVNIKKEQLEKMLKLERKSDELIVPKRSRYK